MSSYIDRTEMKREPSASASDPRLAIRRSLEASRSTLAEYRLLTIGDEREIAWDVDDFRVNAIDIMQRPQPREGTQ